MDGHGLASSARALPNILVEQADHLMIRELPVNVHEMKTFAPETRKAGPTPSCPCDRDRNRGSLADMARLARVGMPVV